MKDPQVSTTTGRITSRVGCSVSVEEGTGGHMVGEHRPLSPFRVMCLAGLLGDPAQLEAAVVDYLLDSGHEYATACYEKGKAEERERCAKVCEAVRDELAEDDRRYRAAGFEHPVEAWQSDAAGDCADAIRCTHTTPPPAPRQE